MGQKEETDTKVNPLVEYWDCFSKIHCLGTPQCFDPCLRTHCVFLFVFLFFLSWEGWNLCGGTSTGTCWGKTTGCSASGPAGRGWTWKLPHSLFTQAKLECARICPHAFCPMEAAATAPEREAIQSEQGDQGDPEKVHRKELTKVRRASIYAHRYTYIYIFICYT